jgi:type 1 glutamine amidotransferase
MTDYKVKIIDSIDAITKNIRDFTVKNTEQYYMLIDPNIKVLDVSEFKNETYQKSDKLKLEQINYLDIDVENDIKGSIMPVIWKKYYGKGRIFYSSIGHNLSDFDTYEVMNIQMRGFRWASEGKYREKKNIISPIFNE